MNVTIMEWNIGGAIFKDEQGVENLEAVAATIGQYSPDIVVLFEAHSASDGSQTKSLAEILDYPFYVEDPISDSHLINGKKSGHGILSRYPLNDHAFKMFANPNLSTNWRGVDMMTHDKGVTSVKLQAGNDEILIQTLHAIPFIPFNVATGSDVMGSIISDMENNIDYLSSPSVIVGDFNIDGDSILNLFPHIMENGFKEVNIRSPTIMNGAKMDRILYKGITASEALIIQLENSGHYPIMSTLEIK